MDKNSNNPIKIAVIGAGVRGTSLARQLCASKFSAKVIAVADPDEDKQKCFAMEFNLPSCAIFTGWAELSRRLGACDGVIIATLDNQHAEPAIACLNRDWHILVEKPLADTFKDCLLIEKAQRDKNRVVAVCHTLRFMDGFRKVKQILDSGTIGQLIHIEHIEGIGHFRFAHNYVRGRWAQENKNTFLLLHKCCHDIDYINWLIEEPCMRVSSFGSLKYFTPLHAPEGSSHRCIDQNSPFALLTIAS